MNPLKINQSFYLNKWFVTPDQNKLKYKQQECFIEPKLMEVLSYLCMNAPNIISVDKIIENCWPNQYVNDNPLHKCIAQLRKILGDTIKDPQYIKTITKRGYTIVAQIRGIEIDQSFNRSVWHDKLPYFGFKAYELEQQAVFFGRTRAIAEIKALLDNIDQKRLPLIFIDGLSSVGKTSLINTAIIPHLEAQDKSIKYSYNDSFYIDLDHYDSESYVLTLIKYLIKINILSEWLDVKKYLLELRQSLIDVCDLKKLIKDKCQEQKFKPSQKIIFIDHFERVLRKHQNNSEHNLMLVFVLNLLKTGDYLIIVSTRSEIVSILNDSIVFKHLKNDVSNYHLLPPNKYEVTEIIQKPVLVAGLRYEINQETFESLDTVIIEDAKNMGNILPILSHTLKDLCENLNDKQQLTFDRYNKIGRLSGALTYNIENILQTLTVNEKALFSNNLHHLIQYTPDKNKLHVAKRADIRLFKGDEMIKLINYFVEHGLLQSQSIDSQIYVSILHDSILVDCNFFKDWISKNYLKLSIITEIVTLTNQWLGSNKNKEYLLYNNYLLDHTNHLIKHDKIEFSSNQYQYLKLSNKLQSKKNKLKMFSLVTLLSLLVFSFILLGINKKTNADLIKTNNNAENLITFMIGDLKDKLRPIGKLELLKIVGDQIIHYYDNRPESVQSTQSLIQYHKALNTIGEVEFNEGKFSNAENIFKQAVKQDIKYFTEKKAKTSALFNYSQSYYWLGYIRYLQTDYTVASKYWSNYLSLSEQLLTLQQDNEKWMLEKSYALNNLGTLNYQQKNYKQAEYLFNLSAQLKKEILDKSPSNSEYIADLADTVSWQANIKYKSGELLRANDLYTESLGLSEKLVKLDSENKNWQQKLALANYHVAFSYYDLGRLSESVQFLKKSLPIYIGLNEFDNTNQIWIKELINNYLMISRIYRHQMDFDNASLNIKRGLDTLKSYSIDSMELESTHTQRFYLNAEMTLISLQLGHNKLALEQFTKSVNIFNHSKFANENIKEAYANYIFALINRRNKQYDQAQLLLSKALKILHNDLLRNDSLNNKSLESMALYVLIEKTLGIEFTRQDYVDFLEKIKFHNPDYGVMKYIMTK